MGNITRVFWCQKIDRPTREGEGGGRREWTSWVEVEEWARSKDMRVEVEKFFETVGG